MKKIVEVIRPNASMRTFATTANIEGVDSYTSVYTKDTEVPEAAKAMVADLWNVPAVKYVSLSRGEVGVEVSGAWEDEWASVSPVILEIVNRHIFGGDGEHSVRDNRSAY